MTNQGGREIAQRRTSRIAFPLLIWGHFLNDGSVNYAPAILPAVMAVHHVPVSLVGSVVLVLQAPSVLQPLVGAWADRVGGHAFVWAGLALSAFGAAAIGLAPTYTVLLGLLLLTGIGNAIFHPQSLTSASWTAGRNRGLRMSMFLIGGELGRGLWPLLASALVVAAGLRGLGWILIPAALTVPVLAMVLPDLPSAPPRTRPRETQAVVGKATAILLVRGLSATAIFGLVTFIPLLWHDRGGSLLAGASLLTTLLVVGIPGNLAGGWLGHRVSPRLWIGLSSLFAALLLALFLFSTGIWSWVTIGLVGTALFSGIPVVMLLSQDAFPGNPSMASGLALGGGNAIGALATFALGPVAAAIGLVPTIWLLVGLLGVAAPLAALLPRAEVPGMAYPVRT